MTFKIVSNDSFNINIKQEIETFRKSLIKNGFSEKKEGKNADYVFIIGGDGTFLRAVREEYNDKTIFVPLSEGRVCHYYDYQFKSNGTEIIKLIKSESFKVRNYPIIEIEIGKQKYYALNEIRLIEPYRPLNISISIDGEFLQKARMSGIIISNSSGSGSINKSFDGAIVDEDINSIQINYVGAIRNSQTKNVLDKLVLSEKRTIEIKSDFNTAIIAADNFKINSKNVQSIKVRLTNKVAPTIVKNNNTFVSRLIKSFLGG